MPRTRWPQGMRLKIVSVTNQVEYATVISSMERDGWWLVQYEFDSTPPIARNGQPVMHYKTDKTAGHIFIRDGLTRPQVAKLIPNTSPLWIETEEGDGRWCPDSPAMADPEKFVAYLNAGMRRWRWT